MMRVIKTLKDGSFGFKERKRANYRLRRAARAVIFDKRGRVAMLHATKYGYYKVPGGGIEKGEDIETGLRREVAEEAGCRIEIDGTLGMTVEYRSWYNRKQISYCYVGHVVGKLGRPTFTADEKKEGFKPVWMGLDRALELVEMCAKKRDANNTLNYSIRFMANRELAILKQAKAIEPGLGNLYKMRKHN